MRIHRLKALWLAAMTLSGCATMTSDFSCNATAKDSCLTIEQVDALTRFADCDTKLQKEVVSTDQQ